MRVTEIGRHPELLLELIMVGELGAVIEGDGLAQCGRERLKLAQELACNGGGGFAGLLGGEQESGGAFMGDEDGLTITAKQHEVGFPMSWCGT